MGLYCSFEETIMMILSSDPKIQAFQRDCMGFMRYKPDKFWDLAIVDVNYGIGASDYKRGGDTIWKV